MNCESFMDWRWNKGPPKSGGDLEGA